MQPRAVLVLYQPGHKLKNHKYILSTGANIVGNNYKCQVIINSKNLFPQEYVANFFINEDFMYVEALCDNMIQLKSNLEIISSGGKKRDTFRYIQKSCRYILPMEEIFYIGPYKSIVQVQAKDELMNIKNILNLHNFQSTPKGDQYDDEPYEQRQYFQSKLQVQPNNHLNQNPIRIFTPEKLQIQYKQNQQHQQQNNKISSNSGTPVIDDQAKSDHTQKLQSDQEAYFQPTLVIQDNDLFAYQPTLALDDNQYDGSMNLHSSSEKKQVSSSNRLNNNVSESLNNNNSRLLKSPILTKSPIRESPLRQDILKHSPYLDNSHTISYKQKQESQPNSFSRVNPFNQPKNVSQISDISMFSRQKSFNFGNKVNNINGGGGGGGFSQQVLYETIKKQQNQLRRQIEKYSHHNEEEKGQNMDEDVSMPDTIQDPLQEKNKTEQIRNSQVNDDEMQMPPTLGDDDMPPTIKDDDQSVVNSPSMKPKLTKTMYQKKQNSSNYEPANNLSKSEFIKKPYEDDQVQDDFMNLFGSNTPVKKIDSNQIQIQQKKQVKQIKKKPKCNYQYEYRNQNVLPHINVAEFNLIKNAFSLSKEENQQNKGNSSLDLANPSEQKHSTGSNIFNSEQRLNNSQSPVKTQGNGLISKKRLFKQPQKPKIANISGFKPKPQDKITLRKRGYQISPDGKNQDYDLLIIGKNYKATPKLLLALLSNRTIASQDWLKDKQWTEGKDPQDFKFEGTIEGISWSLIQKQKINSHHVFQASGAYYFTEATSQFEPVFEKAGGIITKELNKRKKTSIIIDCQAQNDKQFYQSNKASKNWKFYSHRLIGQSILIGQPQFKKYIVDQSMF